jgi:hypothetical protein
MTRPGTSKRQAPRRGQLQELQAKLAEAEEALRAIREGEVDAIIVAGTRSSP